ncbi:MAG TPA: type 1 glutamine amidotransferase [Aromatoleum sp.]|uniref:gamma-glutamyl-gamma-aminobutyrate hydrolase family protein n=1 Tax=Aromatoleum sp. TaxID=2307007 RepID=UPI002B45C6CF|nr:type 1 glutamine amidotransferase [Aromatoleum sp.]HJV26088.1 type 1 glutamine amidotransferase [Aromatoleum sp.]
MSARLLHTPPQELGFPGKTLQYLEQSVAHWIMSHGALAFMMPTIGEHLGITRAAISVHDYVAAMDGLVLQGGADVSPSTYDETPLRPEWSGDRIRDLYEIELLWEFVIQGKPVLGICRGMQLINVACGGTLYQDILEQRPGAHAHRDPVLYDKFHHEIEVEPASMLAQIYPERTHGRVNSIHHQAVNKLGSDLAIEAWSSGDRVVEAIRWLGSGFLFGTQWHPEFHVAGSDLLDGGPIMSSFLAAARAAADT